MNLEQKRKIAELLPDVRYERIRLHETAGVGSLVVRPHIVWDDGQECWPLIGAIVEECERRGWYWKLNPRMAQVWFNKGTGEYKQKYVTDCTKTEAFCLAFLDAVEAGA